MHYGLKCFDVENYVIIINQTQYKRRACHSVLSWRELRRMGWDTPNQEPNRHLRKPTYDINNTLLRPVDIAIYKLEANIVTQVVQRCLPDYKKQVLLSSNLMVGMLTAEEWALFKMKYEKKQPTVTIRRKRRKKCTKNQNKFNVTKRRFNRPTFWGYVEEHHETLTWQGQKSIPLLTEQTPWFRFKWKNEHTGCFYRAALEKLSISRSTMNGLVRVGFAYYTELYKPHRNKWEPV